MNDRSYCASLFILVAAAALGGCSDIRVVRTSPNGGEIALLGDRADAMEKARVEMAANCGGSDHYRILEEGEVVVGESTSSQATADTHGTRRHSGRRGTRTVVTSSETTHDVTEWRVKYACVGPQESAMMSEVREVRVRF